MMDINQNPDQAKPRSSRPQRPTTDPLHQAAHPPPLPPEEKVRILIEGIRGEILVSVLCSREGIGSAVVRQWQEAGIGALVWDRAPSH
jgi:hypothetical protein